VSEPRYLNRAAEAALLGVTPESVTRYRIRHDDYPTAVACPCCGSPVRDRAAVEAWKASRPGRTGRPKKKETKMETIVTPGITPGRLIDIARQA
jgi:hypothetical protein